MDCILCPGIKLLLLGQFLTTCLIDLLMSFRFHTDYALISPLLSCPLPSWLAEPSPELPASPTSADDFGDSETLDIGELDSLTYLEVDSDHDDSDNEADWEEVATDEFQERLLSLSRWRKIGEIGEIESGGNFSQSVIHARDRHHGGRL